MSDECFESDPIEELVILRSLSTNNPPRLERIATINEPEQNNLMQKDISKYVFWGSVGLTATVVAGEAIFLSYRPFFEHIYRAVFGN